MSNVGNLEPSYLRPMNGQHVVVTFNRRSSLATFSLRPWHNWKRLSLFQCWNLRLIDVIIVQQTFPRQNGYWNLQSKHDLKTRWVNSEISTIASDKWQDSTNETDAVDDPENSECVFKAALSFFSMIFRNSV